MQVQLIRRTLLGLVLGLLLLSTVAMGSCSGKYQVLLGQLQQQAKIMQNTDMLLDPYIRIQGLDKLNHKEYCKERPGAFPGKDALRGLSRWGFLQTLNATLGLVLHRLAAFQQKVCNLTKDKDQDWKTLCQAELYIRGIRNNIFCLTRLLNLNGSSEVFAPTWAGPRTLPWPTPSPGAFNRKIDGCKFLQGYHRFMHSVGQVLGEWEEGPSRTRRHSPFWAPQGRAGRTRPSRRAKRPMPRGLLPP
ncbi:oncostatin-M [Trichechus manatus latirostris]|uniref:Oncostatin-M n=1 Tax=Trichechus manatus latirostris TaxID=127582 RepID=A0A2Y9DS02_TRIMA|nr:oncostatin-M [Trichechus manatus latirostris]